MNMPVFLLTWFSAGIIGTTFFFYAYMFAKDDEEKIEINAPAILLILFAIFTGYITLAAFFVIGIVLFVFLSLMYLKESFEDAFYKKFPRGILIKFRNPCYKK